MKKKIRILDHNEKGLKDTLWIAAAIISMTIYILWRIFFTIPEHEIYGWLATICGIFLVVSETVSMLEGTEHFIRLGKKTTPEMPVVPSAWYPDIDVLITTHNEAPELLYKTINGCKHMDYPDRRKVHIFLCDDSDRPEMRRLAQQLEIGYFGLADNKQAKAGNLNNALGKTGSPWIATFDADMIPTHDFLMEVVPYTFLPRMKKSEDGTWVERTEEELDEDYKIGFIQTPQSFYNPDLFQLNFFSERRIPNEQDYFFREVNVGRNMANAPIYAGSNTLISREALNDVGGIAVGTITEDFETGIRIQAKGYTCYAVDKALAHGLSPTDIDSLIKQRARWGRGCISSLRSVHLLTNPGLPLKTKISYIACWMYWWTFFRRFVFILSPILFVLFGIPVVICSLPELIFIWLPSYILYNQALKVTSSKIRNKRWSNTVDTVIFPYLIIPILLETLFIKQKKFVVTKKTRDANRNTDLLLALPQMILLVFDVWALVVIAVYFFTMEQYGSVILLYWLGLNAMHLTMAIFFMMGRQNHRMYDRFYTSLPVEITYGGRKYSGVTTDISETGMGIVLEKGIYLPSSEDEFEISLKTDRYQAVVYAKTINVLKQKDGWKYGVMISRMEEADRQEYFQIVYDRQHTLAKVISTSMGMVDDLLVNVQGRSEKNKDYRRKLPRIELNMQLSTEAGECVSVLDFNYEYIRLNDSGALADQINILIPGCAHSMHCVRSGQRAGLYRISNYKDLLLTDAYDLLLRHQAQTAAPEPAGVGMR